MPRHRVTSTARRVERIRCSRWGDTYNQTRFVFTPADVHRFGSMLEVGIEVAERQLHLYERRNWHDLPRAWRSSGFTINRNEIKRLPAPKTTTTPAYITADEMEATFEENGLTVQGRHLSWLRLACLGQGVPQGAALDRNGVAEDKCHLFRCTGTLSNK
jgi:hypothetical protein